jgi:hypothetical protein
MKGPDGPMQAHMIGFTGSSHAEMFRYAADWFAANDGVVGHILGLGFHKLEDKPYDPEVYYHLVIAYDT